MNANETGSIVSLDQISAGYADLPATLKAVTAQVVQGDYITLTGRSGSGKSTLLNVIAGTVFPRAGSVHIAGFDMARTKQRVRAQRDVIGYLFQAAHLVGWMSAQQNVELGMRYQNASDKDRRSRALAALERVNLSGRLDHRPSELSGGERQRVALARAIARRPQLLLADEPTGNLDNETGANVIELLESVTETAALILVTHDPALARRGSRHWQVADGELHES